VIVVTSCNESALGAGRWGYYGFKQFPRNQYNSRLGRAGWVLLCTHPSHNTDVEQHSSSGGEEKAGKRLQ